MIDQWISLGWQQFQDQNGCRGRGEGGGIIIYWVKMVDTVAIAIMVLLIGLGDLGGCCFSNCSSAMGNCFEGTTSTVVYRKTGFQFSLDGFQSFLTGVFWVSNHSLCTCFSFPP